MVIFQTLEWGTDDSVFLGQLPLFAFQKFHPFSGVSPLTQVSWVHTLHAKVAFKGCEGRRLLTSVSAFNKAWLPLAGTAAEASPLLPSSPLPSQTSQLPLPTWNCPSPGQAPFSQWCGLIGESNSGVPSASWKYNFYRNLVNICGQLGFTIPLTLQLNCALDQMWELLWVFWFGFVLFLWAGLGAEPPFYIIVSMGKMHSVFQTDTQMNFSNTACSQWLVIALDRRGLCLK